MTSPIYFRPAIPLLISLICGIVLGSEYKGFKLGLGTVVILSAACVLRHIYRRQSGVIFPILLFVALGYLSIAPWLQPRFPANHIIHYAGSERWDITGIIDSQPQRVSNRIRLILQVSSLADEHQTHAVTGKLRVTAVGDLPQFAVGDELRLKSRIRLITNFKNPGGFDYRRFMAFKSIRATAYVQGDRIAVVDRNQTSGILQIISKVRNTFSDLIDRSGDVEARAVLKALIVGDRTQISPEMRQAFNRAGVGHLLAISGLHIGIVATVAFVLFQALMVRIKPLLWRAATRKTAALLSLLPVFIYGLIAGFSPSTQRAVIMVAIFLLTFLFESEQDPLNTLSLAALLILVADPPSLFSISFQLSFSAVFAIIYGLSSLQNRGAQQKVLLKAGWFLRFRSKLVSFFLVSFFAICGSLPLVAYYFNQISLVGLAANFIVVPLIGFVTIPLGLLALYMLPISITLASWCIQVGTLILSFALDVVNFFADLPFAAVKTITPSLLEIVCFYIMGWALLNLRPFEPNGVTAPRTASDAADQNIPANCHYQLQVDKTGLRQFFTIFSSLRDYAVWPRKLAKLAVVLVLLTLALDSCYWLYQRFWHTDLRVTVIDVGLGSASLLELPGGHTILVDGGGFADNSTFNVGERIIAPFLWRKKIRTVDTLILSHPNSDHLNGLIYIAHYFNVRNVWTNNESVNTLGYANFMEVIAHKNIHLPVFEDMPRRHRIGGVELNLLYPPPNYIKLRNTQKWRHTNNNSLVVKASLKSISFLFPGDIMAEAEKELVHLDGNNLSSTVLIAPHHGSRTSSSKIFLNAVNPEVVIISSGRNNRFKLPHLATLKRYENQGCTIWRTDVSGAIRLSTDGQQLAVNASTDFGFRN
jgi:competence protein ComEC